MTRTACAPLHDQRTSCSTEPGTASHVLCPRDSHASIEHDSTRCQGTRGRLRTPGHACRPPVAKGQLTRKAKGEERGTRTERKETRPRRKTQKDATDFMRDDELPCDHAALDRTAPHKALGSLKSVFWCHRWLVGQSRGMSPLSPQLPLELVRQLIGQRSPNK
jgi:hypothetical protein